MYLSALIYSLDYESLNRVNMNISMRVFMKKGDDKRFCQIGRFSVLRIVVCG